MINDRILVTPFAWHKQESYQERFSEGCNIDCTPTLLAPNDRLLPFQIAHAGAGAGSALTITEFKLLKACPTGVFQEITEIDLSYNISQAGIFTQYQEPGISWIIYDGLAPLKTNSNTVLKIPGGAWAAKLVTSAGTFWSEYICPKDANQLASFYKVEYYNSCSVGGAVYSTGYKNICYLDAVMLPPKIEMEEEVEKDGYGQPVPVLQRFLYKYRVALPELLHSTAIALATIPLHSDHILYLPDGRSTKMEYVRCEPEFLDCGAIVALEFQESVIIKTSCC